MMIKMMTKTIIKTKRTTDTVILNTYKKHIERFGIGILRIMVPMNG